MENISYGKIVLIQRKRWQKKRKLPLRKQKQMR